MAEMGVKEKSTNHYTLAYDRPEETEGGFLNFLWNKKTGEVLGRNGMSWLKITVFYIIYYICLAIFFVTCYKIFEKVSINFDSPRWALSESLIGENPGIGFRPNPDQDKNTDSSLIWVNTKMESESSYWVDELDRFFNKMPVNATNGQTCTFTNGNKTTESKVCNIDASQLATGCSKAQRYGYNEGKPCVLIKLNKIYGFRPQHYTIATMDNANAMPDSVKEKIKMLEAKASPELDSTWISCEGENPGDKEAIGPLQYFAPGRGNVEFQGIPNYFYPYQNQKNYQTPFLFVKFADPRPNTLIQIECKAWAQNIAAERITRVGSVHFELMVDK